MAAATHVVLLRAVNVGGKNRLPMKALADLLGEVGCGGVRTYIQSGNAVLTAIAAVARRLSERLAAALLAEHGLRVPVVVRSAAELREVVRRNPFPQAVESERLFVAFLSEAPAPAAVKALDPDRSPPDTFEVRGREVYLWLKSGVAGTRLGTDYLDRTLGVVSTIRNWRTVVTLLEMLDG